MRELWRPACRRTLWAVSTPQCDRCRGTPGCVVKAPFPAPQPAAAARPSSSRGACPCTQPVAGAGGAVPPRRALDTSVPFRQLRPRRKPGRVARPSLCAARGCSGQEVELQWAALAGLLRYETQRRDGSLRVAALHRSAAGAGPGPRRRSGAISEAMLLPRTSGRSTRSSRWRMARKSPVAASASSLPRPSSRLTGR
jgi:hypothetical protein